MNRRGSYNLYQVDHLGLPYLHAYLLPAFVSPTYSLQIIFMNL